MEDRDSFNATCWKSEEKGEGEVSLHSTKMGAHPSGTPVKFSFKTVEFSNNIN